MSERPPPPIEPDEAQIERELRAMLEAPPPTRPPEPVSSEGWFPRLTPTQQRIFDSIAKYVLMYGEKGSGKSVAGICSLIRHCYEEDDALALIIAPQIRTGKEGVMYDMMWMLDIWKRGNFDPADPDHKRRIDGGLGIDFDYTESSLDPQTKDRVVFIGNRHGGWSKVILMSIPYAEVVQKRMKALSPSFVYVDEITELDSREFFTYVAQQLGRRRGIKGPCQYMASCNPEGPSHWVYKVWFEDCVDHDTGRRDSDYEVYHVKVQENIPNLPPGYVEGLIKLYKDPVDIQRLLKGVWVDRPTGDAIFKNYFRVEIHVRGDARNNLYLRAHPGLPIMVGYDPGPVNYSVHFEQMVPTKERVVWNVLDELNFVGQFMPDHLVIRQVLTRMDYWHSKTDGHCSFVHIADASAFSHRRHDGTYDATRLVQLSDDRIRPWACPKAAESVPSRVQMIITMLLSETLFISAMCPKTIEMFRLLSSDKPKEGTKQKYDPNFALTPKRSPYLHPFDSLSYPIYYFALHPARFAVQTEQRSEPRAYGAMIR